MTSALKAHDGNYYNIRICIEIVKKCLAERKTTCPGDSGEVHCFFCPECILSFEERIEELEGILKEIEDESRW